MSAQTIVRFLGIILIPNSRHFFSWVSRDSWTSRMKFY